MLRGVALTFSVLCGSVVLLAGAATADAPKPVSSPGAPDSGGPDASVLRTQAKLDALADEILGVHRSESAHEGGYAGAVVHPESGILSLYWKGSIPASVTKAQAEAAAEKLTIVVVPAQYSAQELESARGTLEASVKGKSAAIEPAAAWNKIVTLSDGSGLFVTYNSSSSTSSASPADRSLTAASSARTTGASQVGVASRLQTLAGVPVQAEPDSEPISAMATRSNDTSPFWAGAQMKRPTDATHVERCTTGFGGTRNGHDVLLSAAHCDSNSETGVNGQVWKTGGGTVIGSIAGSTATTDSYDTAFVQIASGSSAGSNYYDGIWNDAGGYNKHVASWGVNHDGDYVCSSGSVTGVHCNLKVEYAGFDLKVGGVTRHNEVQTEKISGVAVGQGDSGGPVVTSPDGTYGPNMQARGIISAGSDTTKCGSTAFSTTCSSVLYFEGLTSVVNTLGFTPYLSHS